MSIPEGVIAAMLTPFDNNGKVNEIEVRKQVNFLIDKGIDEIFPVSSCGEYTHIDMAERKYLIDIVVDEAKGRVGIIPGTGATCYHKSIELANYAKEKGCSAIVLHGPYFFKNTEEVVEGHLKKVAESVDIPIFLYNIPFFANEITPKIAENLCSMPNVVGIKDSSGNMVNVMNLIEMTRKVNSNFKVLVGAEEIMLPALLMGSKGCMTATAGILPEFMTGIWKAYNNKNLNLAYNLQFAILPLIREMKSVNFPQGFKEALSLRGINMGPPKMNYPDNTLAKIADLKTRLEIEMTSMLERYFPGISLKWRLGDTAITPKYKYPNLSDEHTKKTEKKFDDCTMCGICEGDGKYLPEGENNNRSLIKKEDMKKSDIKLGKAANSVDEKNLDEIIEETVRRVLG